VNTTQQVGGALGLAVLATLATGRSDSLSAQGTAQATALVDGYQLALYVGSGFIAIAILLAATVLEAVPEEAERAEVAEPEALEPAYSEAA
jgi:hypothetical protein